VHHPGPPWRFLTLQTVQRWTRPSLVLRTNQTSPCCALLARIHPAQHCSAAVHVPWAFTSQPEIG